MTVAQLLTPMSSFEVQALTANLAFKATIKLKRPAATVAKSKEKGNSSVQQQPDIVQAKRRCLGSKTDVTTTAAYDLGGQEHPQNADQITLTSTCVCQRLEELQVPPIIVNAIFMEFVRIFGEPAALRLFQEEWLKDLHDRWVAFAMFVQERRPADDATSVIPLVFSEFQEQVFALIRLVQSTRQEDAQLSLMLHRSDEQHLALLAEIGHVWKEAF